MRYSIPVLALVSIGVAAVTGCSSDNGPASATVTIRVLTTGSPLDPDGYQVVIGSSPARPIKINDTLTVADVNTGNESVRLDGVSLNCGVLSPNPQPVIASSGSNAIVEFKVVCAAHSGMLRVIVTSTGEDIDPDGYVLQFADMAARHITANGTEPTALTPEGTHALTLSGYTPNCTPSASNPTSVTIVKGDTATLALAVVCTHVAAIGVTITTSGTDLDPDGYMVFVEPVTPDDLHQSRMLAATSAANFKKVWSGSWRVRIENVAVNCHLATPASVALTIASADQQVVFNVACVKFGQLAYSYAGDIYIVDGNGANPKQLTTSGGVDERPDWSPDGARIVFSRSTDGGQNIGVMNADGSGLVMLTDQSGINQAPIWSPDGTTIAYVRAPGFGTEGVYTIPAAGGPAVRVKAIAAGSCSWSPDGTRIVFSTAGPTGGSALYSMRRDGTDLQLVISASGLAYIDPAWGPDGQIAAQEYSTDYYSNITGVVVVDPSTHVVRRIQSNVFSNGGLAPDWSADGHMIAFAVASSGSYYDDDLWITRDDGTSPLRLGITGQYPAWRP